MNNLFLWGGGRYYINTITVSGARLKMLNITDLSATDIARHRSYNTYVSRLGTLRYNRYQ